MDIRYRFVDFLAELLIDFKYVQPSVGIKTLKRVTRIVFFSPPMSIDDSEIN